MTQTIRRELRLKLKSELESSQVYFSASCNWEAKGLGNEEIDKQTNELLDALADAALEVRGIALATDETPGEYKTKPTARVDRTEEEQNILDGMKMAALLNTLSPKAIQDAIRDHFRLTPRWTNKYESQWMEWAMLDDPANHKTPVTPEQIKVAAKLWATDKRFNWSVPTLKGIQEHWLELTEKESESDEWRTL